jgi:SAM-dependent methyltransferase
MAVPVLAFEPNRFRTAAAHYLAGRPAYAPRLIDRVVELTGLRPEHRVLDLGCGPGPLARAFAPRCAEVVGIDPEPAMLAEAAAASGSGNIVWRQGSSYDIGPALGTFHLCTMGRSFHWMDRADTLRRLDGMIGPGGAIVLFNDTHPDLPDNAWQAEWKALLARYGDRRHRDGVVWVRHEAVLLDSAFAALEQASVIERRRTPVAALIDRALSLSSNSPSYLGDRAGPFLAELTRFVNAIAAGGVVTEVVATAALIARR